MSDWFIFSEHFSESRFNFIMVTCLYYFSKYDTKITAIQFKVVCTCEDKDRRKGALVLKWYLEKIEIKLYRNNSENEADSATAMETICVYLTNSDVHSSFPDLNCNYVLLEVSIW